MWAYVPILSFFDQQEKFATSATCVTKLILAAKAAFIRKILCFEVFKILFGQLVERMLENKSLHDREAPPLAGQCASETHFLALLVKNGPLPAKLKCRENTVVVYCMIILTNPFDLSSSNANSPNRE